MPAKLRWHVASVCWPCRGTGRTLRSVQPIAYAPCWCCYGMRGRLFEVGPRSRKIIRRNTQEDRERLIARFQPSIDFLADR